MRRHDWSERFHMLTIDGVARSWTLNLNGAQAKASYRPQNPSTLVVPPTVCGTVMWDRFWSALQAHFGGHTSGVCLRLTIAC